MWTILAAAIAGIFAQVGLPSTQVPASWFGTWKLNVAKSTYSSEPPYRRATRKISPADDGIIIVDDLVRRRGGILHLEWTGKLDGLDYAVQGVEVVLTNAYRQVDDRRWEITQKIDGEVVATIGLTISSDGRTMTSITSSRTDRATTIYEKE